MAIDQICKQMSKIFFRKYLLICWLIYPEEDSKKCLDRYFYFQFSQESYKKIQKLMQVNHNQSFIQVDFFSNNSPMIFYSRENLFKIKNKKIHA